MNPSSQGRTPSGNVKPLIATSLAVIATLYLLTGNLPSSADQATASGISTADRDAVARALTRSAKSSPWIEELIVTAPRITVPEFSLTSPVVEVAVAALPPRLERDPS